jgi:hypothetical protein
MLPAVKTKVAYCKGRESTFLSSRIFTDSFQPAASLKALTRIDQEIGGWALHKYTASSL